MLNITSEIGKLRTVILKRPGAELENLTPATLGKFLFDDIPYLHGIKKEHEAFAGALTDFGTEVLYLEDLIAETLTGRDALKSQFVWQLLGESEHSTFGLAEPLADFMLKMPLTTMIGSVMSGIRKDKVAFEKGVHLHDIVEHQEFFYLDPLPNLYFTRDPSAAIGNGIIVNHLHQPARQRESIFMEYIMKHHPRFSGTPIWLDRHEAFSIEGGDVLVLSPEVVAIGISERTTPQAIENLAKVLFQMGSKMEKVIAIELPKSRAFMHLDTVFTMVDVDKFTIHPGILDDQDQLNIYVLERRPNNAHLQITHEKDLAKVLKNALKLNEILFLPCGGGDVIAAAREQWNDGSNTLAVAPGVVMTYDRNYLSNDMLRE
ncbi:MAG: arginine deiminase, partial [Turicibacter sp.]|nr:arginine deiminase [Turicibacter sp.]